MHGQQDVKNTHTFKTNKYKIQQIHIRVQQISILLQQINIKYNEYTYDNNNTRKTNTVPKNAHKEYNTKWRKYGVQFSNVLATIVSFVLM
jgi:hypothetical protein